MDSKLDTITDDARYLMSAWSRSENTIYDEVDSTFHHYHLDGTLEIASPYLDNTTFYLKIVDERLPVRQTHRKRTSIIANNLYEVCKDIACTFSPASPIIGGGMPRKHQTQIARQ
jgi:hypothetical protein